MKLKWNGFDLELTVDELKQMVDRGLIDTEDDKVPYPETWKELLKGIPIQPNQPVQPSEPLKPYVNPQRPFQFPVVATYGCEMVQSPLGGVAQWDGTTALGGKLAITDNGEVVRSDCNNTDNPDYSKH